MFYKMIENKCKEWYSSDQCTVRNLIEYIEKTGQMRDAQFSLSNCRYTPAVSRFP